MIEFVFVIFLRFFLTNYPIIFFLINWKFNFRSDCSASCGGGKRKRDRLCKESLFPPDNAQWTKRTIDSYGSLALLPRAREPTFDTRRILDPKLCKRGEPIDMGTCNKHVCPG